MEQQLISISEIGRRQIAACFGRMHRHGSRPLSSTPPPTREAMQNFARRAEALAFDAAATGRHAT